MPLFDTNLLVYFVNRDSPFHAQCKRLFTKVQRGGQAACLAQQNLLEFVHVITSPRRIEKPLSLTEATREVKNLTQVFEVIYPQESTWRIFLNLLEEKKRLSTGRIFDFYLAATVLSNGLGIIYTVKTSDFKGVPGIKAINPL